VMVGEIRDYETADIAVQASLTGHLVLSTIHTNTAIGALTRLANMGVQSYLLSNSIVGLVAQRLVRILCPDCKQPHIADEMQCDFLKVDPKTAPTIYLSAGCDNCAHEGYKGRLGIYEIVLIDETLRNMIHNGESELAMEKQARKLTTGIWDDGLDKVLTGRTSIHEVMRVTMED
jgi:general secretion pathway protein E